ncbi:MULTISPECIES: hypothetical protein [Nocardia]|uniref:hypothetical protein n=1 Tax=Nocardia TaxID=1817 RepID=UPI00135858EB|nr:MULTISPECIES: hypothetical protein [Nocardia]MBF6206258.1 hypothetical protein [Streptomyces gardneri]
MAKLRIGPACWSLRRMWSPIAANSDSIRVDRKGQISANTDSTASPVPFPYLEVLVRRVVVQNQIGIFLRPARSRELRESQELDPAVPVTNSEVELAGRRVHRIERVPHSLRAIVGGAQSIQVAPRKPAAKRLQVQRSELIDTHHSPVSGWIIVAIEYVCHLRCEIWDVTGIPSLASVPRHPSGFQDLPRSFPADIDSLLAGKHIPQLRQAPRREQPTQIQAPGNLTGSP